MDKRSAKRLRPGTIVRYGLIGEHRGVVERVSERGGVLIECIPHDAPAPPPLMERAWNDPGGAERWLAYSHIHHVE